MIHVASYLLAAAALIILIKKSRDPQEHAVIVTMFKDRAALAVGAVWMIDRLVTDFIHSGIRGMWNDLVGALVIGFIGASITHLMLKKRNTSKS